MFAETRHASQCSLFSIRNPSSFSIAPWLRLMVLLLALSPTPTLLGQASDKSKPDRNIVFFITDDQGPTLGCYGDRVAATPAIDALARDGARFNQAFATTASCSASRSVVLTGLHNHMNGQYGHTHHFHKFSAYHDVVRVALPRLLSQAGYRTARVGKYHVAPEAVFHFDTTLKGGGRSVVNMANNCRDFINADDDRPFFLYFATTDPHRGGAEDQTSPLALKPNLFGNKPNRQSYPGVNEVFFEPEIVPIPAFLTDSPETRSELAQYYQSCARIDQGLARLVEILKAADVYEKTLIVFTSDHGMAFAGAKTTVYEAGLKVPLVVRNPYSQQRGVTIDALVSHVDFTPTLLDFAGALDTTNPASPRPKSPIDAEAFWQERGEAIAENRDGKNQFDAYHGKSWLPLLDEPTQEHHPYVVASHTFHEIQMYYPMRVYRDRDYKLIWNIAHKLDYPFASDLWAASSWQAQFQKGMEAPYGQKSVADYIQRPAFELYDMHSDPHERNNLATDPRFAGVLARYQARLKQAQRSLNDPWVTKWDYE